MWPEALVRADAFLIPFGVKPVKPFRLGVDFELPFRVFFRKEDFIMLGVALHFS